jgi:dTDP-glucose 4,6-dehydratase
VTADDLVRADLDELIERDEALWRDLRGARFFITGGTGFVGKWLLESLTLANDRFQLRAQAVVLSRDPVRFGARHPRLYASPGVSWLQGDVRDFAMPPGAFTHAIHAATDVVARAKPLDVFEAITKGTARVLDFCDDRHVGHLLLLSSGAIYGRQPPDLGNLDESFAGAPSTTSPDTAYGQGKRVAEWLAVARGASSGLAVRIARCFAFVGPYLPLEGPFAIGNFIADRVAGRPVEVKGDGTPVRSYLHSADLARWLWTILLRGSPGSAYNVGSEEAISVGALANRIATMDNDRLEVRLGAVPPPGTAPERYVPSTRKARAELGLEMTIPLADAISRTVAWARSSC